MINDLEVCIYSPSESIWGGGQIYIENLCRYINKRGVAAVVATSEPESFSCPTLKMESVLSKKKRLLDSHSFARKIKEIGVKVIVLNDLSSLWLAPIFKFHGLKVVSLLHIYLHKKNAADLGYSDAEYHLLRFSSLFCDKVFSVNKENLSAFPVKVDFVGNFVSPWFFGESTVAKKYDLAIISRLSKEKNIPLFIKLVENMNSGRTVNIKALILGRGEEKARIAKAVEQAGLQDSIDLQDWVDRADLPSIYDTIKCFAITSYHEGFATTLLEAHARGVPAIATKSAGFCAEYIEGYGAVTGISFSPEDVKSKNFQQQVFSLIDNAESYYNDCVDKAKLFNEDKVLGTITQGIELLLNKKR